MYGRHYNIEFCHIYAGDVLEQDTLVRTVAEYNKALNLVDGASFSLNVLIDDYNGKGEVDTATLIKEFLGMGVNVNYIAAESFFTSSAEYLLEVLLDNKKIGADEENTTAVLEVKSENLHMWDDYVEVQAIPLAQRNLDLLLNSKGASPYPIVLNNAKKYSAKVFLKYQTTNGTRYACPLLATCWYLARLGVEPFYDKDMFIDVADSSQSFIGTDLLTLLPSYYLQVEATIRQIISFTPWKKHLSSFNYVFWGEV